jgi:hypothetical protein|nr:MAG TPA: hypothetical protein [Caudoviricetes sp.]
MNKSIVNVLIFAAGAAIGSVATWKFVETKYKRIAQEEINSVKEVFSRRKTEDSIEAEPVGKNTVDENDEPYKLPDNVNELYAKILGREGYTEKKGGVEEMPVINPRIITPEEFAENPAYDTVSLTYYEDDVYEDEWGVIYSKDDIEATVGLDAVNHFGEYEDDSVFVRNDDMLCDYEILRDTRTYRETYGKDPDTVDE